ncbi:hypothetical protein DFH05DRAFT_241346 [Lentinula detonsa]|uniref:Uncharacterized protein n=1 Tax=Lentinula detonsa TaxID=2804962 RepID=A0A9W8NVI0_9AGAR|nr:hypothetical protein DFH05DRAFT_241346 [Lentinula detonsa]
MLALPRLLIARDRTFLFLSLTIIHNLTVYIVRLYYTALKYTVFISSGLIVSVVVYATFTFSWCSVMNRRRV